MPRKTIGVLVLTGITLSGALGGQADAGGRPHAAPARVGAAVGAAGTLPVPAAPIAAPPAVSGHRGSARDVFALAGDQPVGGEPRPRRGCWS